MTILYRSPNVTVDGVEFHVTVEQRHAINVRPPVTRTYFRKRNPTTMWQPVEKWIGRLPKGLRKRFRKYQVSIRDARATGDAPVMRTPQRSVDHHACPF